MKKYKITWRAEITGSEIIEAFDEQEAEENFDTLIHEDRIPQDRQIYAEIDYVEEVKEIKKKVKNK